MAGRRTTPHGRDAVMAAVHAAAVDLLAEHGPREVTVRAVASRAGVNHALIHRHFGTKDELLRSVVARESRTIGEQAAQLSRTDAAGLLALLRSHQAYWRVLARLVLDEPSVLAGLDLPAAGMVLDLITGRAGADEQARVAAAVAGSTALGWLVFGPHLAGVLGVSDPSRLEPAVADAVSHAVRQRRSTPSLLDQKRQRGDDHRSK